MPWEMRRKSEMETTWHDMLALTYVLLESEAAVLGAHNANHTAEYDEDACQEECWRETVRSIRVASSQDNRHSTHINVEILQTSQLGCAEDD